MDYHKSVLTMSKRELSGLTEAWLVWVGETPAVRVATEHEARNLLLREGRDYEFVNGFNRPDMACPVVEILWNESLPDGETFHAWVASPVLTVLRRGQLRKVLARRLPPSKFGSTAKSWYALEPRFPAWWPHQYLSAINDPETLVLRGSKPIEAQIDARWPQP
ncbi:hypothetical protein [Burkholderia ambifaria]|uniref:hypothetical protein n=1 Tax=Burkholderia ambifaria TaxID=152480 RepID=UPI000F80043C|nr:hypothetical protein [Burkholderia ambifaria]